MSEGPENGSTGASALWRLIEQTSVTKTSVQDLSDLKSSAVNFKLALWNPRTNGVRYLKTLTYSLCASMSPENWRRLSLIHNRHIGRPWSVTYNGQAVCLDYLQAVFELEFMERHVNLEDATVVEIGAGYGRTCHAVLANHVVRRYDIVDLPNCLELAGRYLREVLPRASFDCLRFVAADEFAFLGADQYTLAINIDSFAEMDADVVRRYLEFVRTHSDALYVKNPVGK